MNEEQLYAIGRRMQDSAEKISFAVDRLEEATNRLAYMFENGYGGNALRLIELLEKFEANFDCKSTRKRKIMNLYKLQGTITKTNTLETLWVIAPSLELAISFCGFASDVRGTGVVEGLSEGWDERSIP